MDGQKEWRELGVALYFHTVTHTAVEGAQAAWWVAQRGKVPNSHALGAQTPKVECTYATSWRRIWAFIYKNVVPVFMIVKWKLKVWTSCKDLSTLATCVAQTPNVDTLHLCETGLSPCDLLLYSTLAVLHQFTLGVCTSVTTRVQISLTSTCRMSLQYCLLQCSLWSQKITFNTNFLLPILLLIILAENRFILQSQTASHAFPVIKIPNVLYSSTKTFSFP